MVCNVLRIYKLLLIRIVYVYLRQSENAITMYARIRIREEIILSTKSLSFAVGLGVPIRVSVAFP